MLSRMSRQRRERNWISKWRIMASSDCGSVRSGAIAQINPVRKSTKGEACRSNHHPTTSNCSISASCCANWVINIVLPISPMRTIAINRQQSCITHCFSIANCAWRGCHPARAIARSFVFAVHTASGHPANSVLLSRFLNSGSICHNCAPTSFM